MITAWKTRVIPTKALPRIKYSFDLRFLPLEEAEFFQYLRSFFIAINPVICEISGRNNLMRSAGRLHFNPDVKYRPMPREGYEALVERICSTAVKYFLGMRSDKVIFASLTRH